MTEPTARCPACRTPQPLTPRGRIARHYLNRWPACVQHCAGGRTEPEPASLYDQMITMFGGPLPPYVPPPRDACPCGGTQTIHAPDCPIHPMRLRWAAQQATAQLPQELRDAGMHFEYDTTEDER